jgi:hypothetical protein
MKMEKCRSFAELVTMAVKCRLIWPSARYYIEVRTPEGGNVCSTVSVLQKR